jgi:hypothetical protein
LGVQVMASGVFDVLDLKWGASNDVLTWTLDNTTKLLHETSQGAGGTPTTTAHGDLARNAGRDAHRRDEHRRTRRRPRGKRRQALLDIEKQTSSDTHGTLWSVAADGSSEPAEEVYLLNDFTDSGLYSNQGDLYFRITCIVHLGNNTMGRGHILRFRP